MADVRAAAEPRSRYDEQSVATRYNVNGRDVIAAAAVADLRESPENGPRRSVFSWAAKYRVSPQDIRTWINAAAVQDARAAAAAGSPLAPGRLVDKYGITPDQAEAAISNAAFADAREAADSGRPLSITRLARNYGKSRSWAYGQTAAEPFWAGPANSPEFFLPDPAILPARPAGADELRARAEIRAAVDNGVPINAEELGRRFGKSYRWALDQVDAAAHADVYDALAHGKRYAAEALAANYGMSRAWAVQQITQAHAIERAKSRDAADGLELDVDRPYQRDELARDHGISQKTATAVFERAAEDHVKSVLNHDLSLRNAFGSVHRLGMGRRWTEARFDAAAQKFIRDAAHQGAVPDEGALVRKFRRSPESVREMIRNAVAADMWQNAAQGLRRTSGEVGQEYGLSDAEAEALLASVAVAEANVAAVQGVPYPAQDLAGRYGKNRRWAFDQIGAAVRADAASGKFTTGELAARYGVSRRSVEYRTGNTAPDAGQVDRPESTATEAERAYLDRLRSYGAQQPPNEPRYTANRLHRLAMKHDVGRDRALELTNDAARADVRAAADRGEPYTAAELAERYHIVDRWGADRIADVAQAAAREAADRGDPHTADDLVRMYGISHDEAEAAIVAAALADEQRTSGKYGIGPETVGKHLDTVVRADVRNAADRREPHTDEALAEKYGLTRPRAIDLINTAALDYLADAAEVKRPFMAVQLVERFGQDTEWAERLKHTAARAGIRAAADGRHPYLPQEVQDRYHVDTDDALPLISAAAREDVQASANRGEKFTPHSLAVKYDMGTEEAARVIRAAARADVHEGVNSRSRRYNAQLLSERFGISLDVAGHELSAAALAHARAARRNGEPWSAQQLVEWYGIPFEEAKRHAIYARHVPADSDVESDVDYVDDDPAPVPPAPAPAVQVPQTADDTDSEDEEEW